jgi:putative transposase
MRSLQKFATVHSSVHDHFNLESQINDGNWIKENLQIALAEWRQLAA